jgi:hypothetical protein
MSHLALSAVPNQEAPGQLKSPVEQGTGWQINLGSRPPA